MAANKKRFYWDLNDLYRSIDGIYGSRGVFTNNDNTFIVTYNKRTKDANLLFYHGKTYGRGRSDTNTRNDNF